ncbi:MAG: acyl-[acyl-carrier-protein] thioesterase [Chloroflexota bacterium]|nr:MAG: acyl-[acyl-carrier-protein] thioesterase [Chloroflexota bacterium]
MTSITLQVRPSDCDSLDHVNNSAYVAYVQHGVAERLSGLGFAADWSESGPCRWEMQDLAIEYRLASSFGDQLAAQVWLAEADAIRPVFGCEIERWNGDDRQVVVRAESRWQRLEAGSGKPVTLADAQLSALNKDAGNRPRRFKRPADSDGHRRYHWRHRVERAEVGLARLAHPHVVFEWIEESVLSASAAGGWPIERCLEADFVVFQMRHDTTFFGQPALGQALEITSRLVDVRRLRGTWQNEIRDVDSGRLLVNNYSTGVFLNLAGRPTSPPPGMMEALQSPIESEGTSSAQES